MISLNLSNNQLDGECYSKLFEEIGRQEQIESLALNLQKNSLTYQEIEGMINMIDGLKEKRECKVTLDLRWNGYLDWRYREKMIEYSKCKE